MASRPSLSPEDQRPPGAAWPAAREGLVVGAYLVAAVIVTYPLVRNLFSLTGPGTTSQMLWNFWWVREALVHRHTNPFFTPMLFHPEGAGLAFHTLSIFNCVAFMPVSFLVSGMGGLLLAYRVEILVALTLSGYCTYRLVVRLTRRPAAGFIAGLFFAFRSLHIGQQIFPHLNSMFWIPLYALALIRLLEGIEDARGLRIARRVLALGLVFAFATYTSTEYALFLFCFMAFYVCWQLAVRPKAWRGIVAASCAVYLWAVALLLPLLWAMHREQEASSLYRPALGQDVLFSADIVSFVLPGGRHFLFGPLTGGLEARVNHGIKGNDVFLGYVGIILLAGSFLIAKRRRWSVWSFSAIVFFLLSLGPYLHVGGVTWQRVWLPYLFLKKLPLMGLFRTPIRFHTMFVFASSVIVGFGVSSALSSPACQRVRRLWARSAYTLLAVLLAVECKYDLSRQSPRAPQCVPRVYEFIAKQPGDFAIADLPTGYLCDRQYMAYQTMHGKRLFNGSLSRKPLVTGKLSNAYDRGFRFVLVHKRFFKREKDFREECGSVAKMADFLWTQGGVALFRVRKPGLKPW